MYENIFNYLPVFYPEDDEIDYWDEEEFLRQEEIERYEFGERLRNNKLRPYERREWEISFELNEKFNWELFEKIRYEEMLTSKHQFILL